MNNVSCSSFSSINEMLTQANTGNINVTTTVASCPDICSLAWGAGNPDLSGIGANISYIFQAVLTVLCGPLLSFLYERREKWKFSEKTNKHLSALQDTFLDISAQFSIPVAIAAVIRFRQEAPFYELAFLRSLTTMQFLSLLATSVISGLFEEPDRRGPQRIIIIILYGLLEFGFYLGLISGLVTSRSSWETISELKVACTAYSQIFPWIKHIPPPAKVHLPRISVKQFFDPFSKQGWKFSFIIIGFIFAGVIALVLAVVILFGGAYFLIQVLTGRDFRWFAVLMSLGFSVGTIVELVAMERTRDVMKGVTGAEFEDNQWGFGQVIALFLWLPLCSQFAYYVMRFDFVRTKPEERPDAEQGHARKSIDANDESDIVEKDHGEVTENKLAEITEISKDESHDRSNSGDVEEVGSETKS